MTFFVSKFRPFWSSSLSSTWIWSKSSYFRTGQIFQWIPETGLVNITIIFLIVKAINQNKASISEFRSSLINLSVYLIFEINLVSMVWIVFKKTEMKASRIPDFFWKICLIGKILVALQICAKDKLLDQNGWSFDTKNINLYSFRLD